MGISQDCQQNNNCHVMWSLNMCTIKKHDNNNVKGTGVNGMKSVSRVCHSWGSGKSKNEY